MAKMTNLLTLDSDEEFLRVKEDVENEELISYDSIAYVEDELGIKGKHEQFKELLIIFDKFCRKNGIRYSLADGTLLGAYRHHMFIPWDDDADVMMTRKEFIKFERALRKGTERSSSSAPSVAVTSTAANKDDRLLGFKLLFCHRVSTEKMYKDGIIMDVFVIDNIPKSRVDWARRKFLSRLLRISCFNRMSLSNIKNKTGAKKVAMYIGFPIVLAIGRLERMVFGKKIFSLNENIAKVRSVSGYSTKYTSNWRELNRIFKREWFDEYEDIQMEGYSFMAIKGAEDYLVDMFGDWKKIPPVEEIKREHDHVPQLLMDDFINGWTERIG